MGMRHERTGSQKQLSEYLGGRLKELREKHALTQLELSEACGLHESAISHYECYKRLPSIDSIINVCEFLEMTVDEFLGEAKPVIPKREKEFILFDKISKLGPPHFRAVEAVVESYLWKEEDEGK